MTLRGSLCRMLQSAHHRLNGYEFPQVFNFLEESQWWSQDLLKSYQGECLGRLIRHAYEKVPYYRRVMERSGLRPVDFNKVEDLIKLPVLTKDQFREHWRELLTVDLDHYKVSFRTTGGTTGEPIRMLLDRTSGAWSGAAFSRGRGWAGYRRGEKLVRLFGGSLGLYPTSLKDKFKSRFFGEVFLPAFELSAGNIERYARKVKESGALYINGYTSALYLFALLLESKGIDLSVKGVFPTAEPLLEPYREKITKVLRAGVFDGYGCGEVNSIAFECESHNGMHITEEHVVVETLVGGKPVVNQPGEITLTELHNYAMPLIRYQNGDIGIISTEPCSCGRGLARLTKIVGRSNDLLVAKDGRLVSGCFAPCLFRNTKGVQQFQIIQESKDFLRLNVVKNENFRDEEMDIIHETIRRSLGEVEIKICYLPEIPVSRSGKLRFVISKVAPDILNSNETITF